MLSPVPCKHQVYTWCTDINRGKPLICKKEKKKKTRIVSGKSQSLKVNAKPNSFVI